MHRLLVGIVSLFYLGAGSLPAAAQASVLGRAGELSGHWYDPEFNGQGLTFEVLENGDGLVFWFTYDNAGNQIWILGQGPMEGNRLEVDAALITSGGRFDVPSSQQAAALETWGSIALDVHDCSNASFEYSGPPDFGQGTRRMVRLSTIDGRACSDRRPFRLGFTPFPAAVPTADGQALADAYALLRDNADLVAHHFDDGIPWPEALAGGGFESYPADLQADWAFRRSMSPAGHQVYVAITPISISRDQLAPYRGAAPDTPLDQLGPEWANADFDSEIVRTAFLNHAVTAIEFFRPDYLAIGIEVNLLKKLDPERWPAYLDLHRHTWSELRTRYPSLPIFASITAADMLGGLTDADVDQQRDALADLEPYMDLIGISFYPFLSSLGTGPVPREIFQQIDQLSTTPKAIVETGLPAQFQSLEIDPGAPPFVIDGTPAAQQEFIRALLTEAQRYQFRFVVNFIVQDYDALCDAIECLGWQRLWQDTGLWDENGQARPALSVWREHLEREVVK
ncbi:hypothetical protein HFP89_15025 [Wenzhouxiangella sp. XN79A]|uniref:hypothetical protein n=1 Tax=Wenzhouxiangella sp. XN79A TaxID=2724193 RepID=UPI00144AC60A|nr:hypothetical protein [Wenzhouxiangella sp. XN79A]NKI36481.1 hypothetical protein [Wenzhouxiangella sp. XN79A]